MSWKPQFNEFADWQVPSTQSKNSQCTFSNLDDLSEDDLFPEPRQLDSSEFSELTEDSLKRNRDEEEDVQLIKFAKVCGYNWDIATNVISNASNFQRKEKPKATKKTKPSQEIDEEKDKMIISLYKTYGGNWRKIATFFDGLNASIVKNRFYNILRPKMTNGEIDKEQETEKIIIDNKLNEKLQGKTDVKTLSEQDKKNKLQGLYQKMNEIEDFIKQTKSQIHTLVIKGAKN